MLDLSRVAVVRPPPSSTDPESGECVILTSFIHDFACLATLLCHSGITMHRAGTIEEADFLLTVTGAPVLVCDAAVMDGTWMECARMVASFHPRVSLIVLADTVDGQSIQREIGRGVWALSEKPICFHKMRTLMQAAREASMARFAMWRGAASGNENK